MTNISMIEIIGKKKKGKVLSGEEIDYLVEGFTKGKIPDYQMAAFLMAVFFSGMNHEETAALTSAYVNSGDTIDLSEIPGIKVDKHSSGGVGDKPSLIIMALCAACDIPVAKMSGRGLGHTGGTIDKLEAIKGFRTALPVKEFISNVKKYGMAISGQTARLAPADKKIYALRDVTSTVDSIPLIAASIMSKKIASGADCFVLDVKTGTGAFMKTLEKAEELARTMVAAGNSANRKTIALITDMNQPLGREIGNALEIREVVETLKGYGEKDVETISLEIAAHMAVLNGKFKSRETALKELDKKLRNGNALDKFRLLVEVQGGDAAFIDNIELLPSTKYHVEVKSQEKGYINSINTENIGMAACFCGAGRLEIDDVIDMGAGITVVKKTGDYAYPGDVLCIMHTNKEEFMKAYLMIVAAYSISDNFTDFIGADKLIRRVIGSEDQ